MPKQAQHLLEQKKYSGENMRRLHMHMCMWIRSYIQSNYVLRIAGIVQTKKKGIAGIQKLLCPCRLLVAYYLC
jgi:hypothetical protein